MKIFEPISVVYNAETNRAAVTVKLLATGQTATYDRTPYYRKRSGCYDVIIAGTRVIFDRDGAIRGTEIAYEIAGKAPYKADIEPAVEPTAEPVEAAAEPVVKPAGVEHYQTATIETCLQCGIPVFLVGPAGSGKNHAIETICKRNGWDFYFSNSIQQEFKLTGFVDAGGKYHETEFYKACVSNKKCVFFLDELDASTPEVLVLLNAAIANGYFDFPGGRGFVRLENVLFAAAGNTCGSGAGDMYTGRFALDQATLDRFAMVDFGYDPKIEESLTSNNFQLLDFVRALRKASENLGVRATFSYRCLQMVAKLEAAGMALEKIIDIAILRGIDAETCRALLNAPAMLLCEAGGKNRYYHAARKM